MVFLGKPLLKQPFEKELAEHQAKLDVQLAKAEYEIESHNHDREIERFKAQLEIAAHEWQTVFDTLIAPGFQRLAVKGCNSSSR